MIEISYFELFLAISVIWILVRFIIGMKQKKISILHEVKLLLVYICIVVIARFVNFPLGHVDGHIGTMKLDFDEMFPLWVNFLPVVHLFDVYDGWQINIIGNIAMFIPVGIVWPICFAKLDTFGKTVLAGWAFSIVIEIFQLPFYERCSDVDDIILNTLGVVIGAAIVFAIRKFRNRKTEK